MDDGKQHAANDKDWQNPVDPEAPADERNEEQLIRQKKEAERRHDNLTDKKHIDKDTNNEQTN